MADTLDVLTLAEARSVLSLGAFDASQDDPLARVVTAVSRRLDEYIGPVVKRSVTSEVHSGGSTRIELAYGPVSAVSAVTEYQGTTATVLTAETAGTVPADGYYAERWTPNPSLLSGVLIRRCSGSTGLWWPGGGNVLVSYSAGRSVSTGSVDAKHKEAAGLMLRNLWRPYQQSIGGVDEFDTPTQNFPVVTIPKAVVDMLADEAQPMVGFG